MENVTVHKPTICSNKGITLNNDLQRKCAGVDYSDPAEDCWRRAQLNIFCCSFSLISDKMYSILKPKNTFSLSHPDI